MKTSRIVRAGLAVAVAFLGAAYAHAAYAQEAANRPVKAIEIKGLKTVSEQLVRSQLEVQAGQMYNPSAVARDIRRLYSMGHFDTIKADVAPQADGLILTYVFEEKRTIDSVKIIGNKRIKTTKIRAVLSWKEGDSFAPDAYDEERKAILKLYEEKGFANSSVDIAVEEVGPSRVRLTYSINEGKKARVRSITFKGNQVLTDHKLRKAMKTHTAFWFIGGKYNDQKFENDLKSIVDKYGDIGHLEAAVTGTNVTYSENGKNMDVVISLSEGPQYKVGALESAGNVVYDDDEILGIVKVHPGDVHNKGQVAKDAEMVAKGYQDSGYVNAEVTPQVTLDRENKTTHIVYNLKEGDLKYVRQITVTGNTTTKDEVVRRDLLVTPGERFDGGAVKESQQRLENTQYFENVRLTLHDLDDTDLYTDLMTNVEEGKTGNFNFGVGYSSEEKIGGFTELRLNNFDITNWPKFSGGGQILTAKLNLGTVRQQYNIGFTEPEIFGYPLAFGFDVFDESYKYTQASHYTEQTAGGQLRLGKALSPYVTLRTALRYTNVSYSDLSDRWLYTSTWRRELVESDTLANIWSIERNTLDFKRDPATGSKHVLALTVAGFGADNDFVKLEHDSSWYFPLSEDKKWVLMLRTREGWATEYGSSDFVPISERFFAGGTTTVKGYRTRDIGPKAPRYWYDPWKKEALGGNLRLVDNLEVKYKVTKIFRVYGFVDAGGVWEDTSNIDLGEIRVGTGVGLGADIPKLGPIRVDYGFPLNPDHDQSSSGRLHLMTGFSF